MGKGAEEERKRKLRVCVRERGRGEGVRKNGEKRGGPFHFWLWATAGFPLTHQQITPRKYAQQKNLH